MHPFDIYDMPIVPVYVPMFNAKIGMVIAAGSGIVGKPATSDSTLIYYEGNIFNSQSLRTWFERIVHAWGRMKLKYPTKARAVVPDTEIVKVGEYNTEAKIVTIHNRKLVRWWIGNEEIPECLASKVRYVYEESIQQA